MGGKILLSIWGRKAVRHPADFQSRVSNAYRLPIVKKREEPSAGGSASV